MKAFRSPRKSLGNLDAEAAATMIAAAADVAVIVDDAGVIRDISFHSDSLATDLEGHAHWLGQPWIDTVTVESRPKIEALLREAANGSAPRWRHVNHPAVGGGADIPILYSGVQIAASSRVVAFGRDLRAISALQQRLVDAQQSMERDYSRLRHVEMRYRLLFQMSSEALLILDAATQKVLEANPAAFALLGETAKRVLGRALPDVFDAAGTRAVQALLTAVRAAGRADTVQAQLGEARREVAISASLFREENATLFLVRFMPLQADAAAGVLPRAKAKLLKLVESAPDGFVITSTDGRIITANAAFLEMAQLAAEEQAQGESLERWLGRPGVDLEVLVANLRQRGLVRLFATVVNGEYGATAEVEVSAVVLTNGGQPCHGFAIRNIGRRIASLPAVKPGRELPRSVEQLTELIGRVSLKELVREATDVIERLSIEAALQLTGDNRASAAEMLGLSRQSLYVKLRRYGLGDLAGATRN